MSAIHDNFCVNRSTRKQTWAIFTLWSFMLPFECRITPNKLCVHSSDTLNPNPGVQRNIYRPQNNALSQWVNITILTSILIKLQFHTFLYLTYIRAVTDWGCLITRHRNPVGATFSAPVQTGTLYNGTVSLSRGLSGQGVALTTLPYLVPKLKSRAIPLLPLWAFLACSRVTFTFYICLTEYYNMGQRNTRTRKTA